MEGSNFKVQLHKEFNLVLQFTEVNGSVLKTILGSQSLMHLSESPEVLSRSQLEHYCADYLWSAGISPNSNPELKVSVFEIYPEEFFTWFYTSGEWNRLHGITAQLLFTRGEKEYCSPILSDMFNLWVKSIAKNPVYIHPLDGQVCKKEDIEKLLGDILDYSNLTFYDLFEEIKGLFIVYSPKKDEITKVMEFLHLRQSASTLGLRIVKKHEEDTMDVLLKLMKLFGITYVVEQKLDCPTQ